MSGSDPHHAEVLAALQAIGNPRRGAAVQADRGSALPHLGIGFPALRARVKAGFSFSSQPQAEQLRIWHALWQHSPCGDVLFAALAFLEPIVRKVPPELWPLLRTWVGRIDNWCHADMLAGVCSRVLQQRFDEVYPTLQSWSASNHEWQRRLSLTSLIHYSGKNAVFLAPGQMLPLLAACVPDPRQHVATAVGWVLRELAKVHPAEAEAFLEAHAGRLQPRTLQKLRSR